MDEFKNGRSGKEISTVLNGKPGPGTNNQLVIPSTPLPPQKPLPPEYRSLARRMRVNRIIMRKKRAHERYGRDIAPRLVLSLIIFMVVLAVLLSTGVGGAYAYYRSQLPLLNGVADHSLFQSTHIYDRTGKLLYELYDHQEGHGRRNYVDYTQIPSLL